MACGRIGGWGRRRSARSRARPWRRRVRPYRHGVDPVRPVPRNGQPARAGLPSSGVPRPGPRRRHPSARRSRRGAGISRCVPGRRPGAKPDARSGSRTCRRLAVALGIPVVAPLDVLDQRDTGFVVDPPPPWLRVPEAVTPLLALRRPEADAALRRAVADHRHPVLQLRPRRRGAGHGASLSPRSCVKSVVPATFSTHDPARPRRATTHAPAPPASAARPPRTTHRGAGEPADGGAAGAGAEAAVIGGPGPSDTGPSASRREPPQSETVKPPTFSEAKNTYHRPGSTMRPQGPWVFRRMGLERPLEHRAHAQLERVVRADHICSGRDPGEHGLRPGEEDRPRNGYAVAGARASAAARGEQRHRQDHDCHRPKHPPHAEATWSLRRPVAQKRQRPALVSAGRCRNNNFHARGASAPWPSPRLRR